MTMSKKSHLLAFGIGIIGGIVWMTHSIKKNKELVVAGLMEDIERENAGRLVEENYGDIFEGMEEAYEAGIQLGEYESIEEWLEELDEFGIENSPGRSVKSDDIEEGMFPHSLFDDQEDKDDQVR